MIIPPSESAAPTEQSIVLTGFMGTGKSTVGQLIAARLVRPFLDTDAEIERRFGKPITRIFEQDGEAAFRLAERDLVAEIASLNGWVVATGGGMLVDAANRARLLEACFVVCLDTPLVQLERRLRRSPHRPLAADWRARYAQRQPAYAAIPRHVENGDLSPEQAADQIIELWHEFRASEGGSS